jgi:hypothetical protein
MRYHIDTINPECFAIVGTYPDGFTVVLGLYTSRRDAVCELRLIREVA